MNLDKLFNPKAGLAAAALATTMLTGCSVSQPPGHERKYGEFVQDVKAGKVTSVKVENSRLVDFSEADGQYYSYIPPGASVDNVVNGKVSDYSGEKPADPSIWPLILNFAPPVLMIGFFLLMMKQMSGAGKGAMSFGKSRAKLDKGDGKKVTFKDVAGCDEAKAKVQQIVEFLRNPKKYQATGGKMPKGTLLVGPPGTGKTLLARAIAGEADVPFYHISGSDFVEMFVGVGASRVRDLFEQGKKNAPCIIFIDEIDAVGRHRGAGLGGGHDEREQTLNQLLVEMDGFESSEGVVLIAGTNRPDVLDPALLRPGRFNRRITVALPDARGREEILKVHVRNKPLADDVDLKVVARGTPGFSGADLENLANEAALLAADLNKKKIDMGDFEHAKDTIMLGEKYESRPMSPEERELTAWHEAGHALLALHQEHSDPIHKASILSRGRTGGVVWRLPETDRNYTRVEELKADLVVATGGRLAEEYRFKGNVSSGASSDIAQATNIVHSMVAEWGMGGEELSFLSYASDQQEVFLGRSVTETKKMSEETARMVDVAMRKLADSALATGRQIIKDHADQLERIAKALLEYEELTGEEVRMVAEGKPINREKGSIAFARPSTSSTPSQPPPVSSAQTFRPA